MHCWVNKASRWGIVFDRFLCLFIYLFLCFFVSKITRKRLDRFAWIFQGRCGVTMGRPDSILGQFRKTARCRDANFFVSILSTLPAIGSSGSLLLPSSDWECNEVFCIATRRRGFAVVSHHSLLHINIILSNYYQPLYFPGSLFFCHSSSLFVLIQSSRLALPYVGFGQSPFLSSYNITRTYYCR